MENVLENSTLTPSFCFFLRSKDIAISKIPQHGQNAEEMAQTYLFLKNGLDFFSFIRSQATLTCSSSLRRVSLKKMVFLNLE